MDSTPQWQTAMANGEAFDYFQVLADDPPEKLIMPVLDGALGINIDDRDALRRECRIWQGYFDASSLLLREMMTKRAFSENLIYPAMFNLRHALEIGLKWHIRYAGGEVPKEAGHDLRVLIDTFRSTADGLDEDTTYISDYDLDLIAELAAIDPRSVAFRYATEVNGSPIELPKGPWNLCCLSFTVDFLSIWFDHLSGYIDMSDPDYQAMMREIEAGQSNT